jgi:hypothetical protein
VEASLERHKQAFGYAPELYGADRGFFSEKNVTLCEQVGVTVVLIPRRGGKRTPEREAYEKSAAFKQGQRFRAGIEGRISVNDGPGSEAEIVLARHAGERSSTPVAQLQMRMPAQIGYQTIAHRWMTQKRPDFGRPERTYSVGMPV